MNNRMAVVYCCDAMGIAKPWLEHSLKSLRKHGDYDVFVASPEDLGMPDTTWIDANLYIKQFDLGRIMKMRYHRGSCDPMILFRIVLPIVRELGQYDRFLYIDCDTEIISPIDEVFSIDKGRYDMAGVLDSEGFRRKKCKSLRLLSPCHILSCENSRDRLSKDLYVNSGVLMFYPNNILKRHNYIDKTLNLLNAMLKHKLFWDQDLINLGFNINIIDGKWNSLVEWKNLQVPNDACIAHFIGKGKLDSYPPNWRFKGQEA